MKTIYDTHRRSCRRTILERLRVNGEDVTNCRGLRRGVLVFMKLVRYRGGVTDRVYSRHVDGSGIRRIVC